MMKNLLSKRHVVLLLLCACGLWVSMAAADDRGLPAQRVINRQLGEDVQHVNFKMIAPSRGKETFSIESSKGILTISGSSQVALCYAFRHYLNNACGAMKTWSGEHLPLPAAWPEYHSGLQTTPYDYRYFLNVCTYGYTTPYWDWERWEKEIDWMVLHGVNFPLATVAAEAIAQRVWLRLGLDRKDIQSFFTAPAHLPWHRMGNLNSWDGGLSDRWHNEQIDLQHLILNRMRELDMHPIAPAFAGFVPMAFVEKHPEIKFNHLKWGGFDEKYNAYVLPPDSPFFVEIGKMFVEEWEKEFGKTDFYLSDSFNEMELPIEKGDTEGKHRLLTQYGETIYKSIAAANPDAVWVTQGWTFGYHHSFWDKEGLTALLSHVPDDKMIIIDLGNEFPKWVWKTEQTWKVHEGFYRKKWIYSYVPNFGGKNLLTGDLGLYASASKEALDSDYGKNLVGFGSAPEGIENNEVIYELLADMGWSHSAIDLDAWLKQYCIARYGGYPKQMKQAWELLRKSSYGSYYSYPRFTWQTAVPDTRRKSKVDMSDDFFRAIEQFLSCADDLKSSSLYRNDAIEFAAFYVCAKADRVYVQALEKKRTGNWEEANRQLEQVIALLRQADKLLQSHPLHRLDRWVEQARSNGQSVKEKDFYEANAKRLITSWGGIQEDYAARTWAGLIKDYYIPRLQLHFTDKKLDAWEEKWITTPWHPSSETFQEPLKEAVRLVKGTAI